MKELKVLMVLMIFMVSCGNDFEGMTNPSLKEEQPIVKIDSTSLSNINTFVEIDVKGHFKIDSVTSFKGLMHKALKKTDHKHYIVEVNNLGNSPIQLYTTEDTLFYVPEIIQRYTKEGEIFSYSIVENFGSSLLYTLDSKQTRNFLSKTFIYADVLLEFHYLRSYLNL